MSELSATFKVCNKCGNALPFGDFYTDRKAPDGLTRDCKTCRRAGVADYKAKTRPRNTKKVLSTSERLDQRREQRARLKAQRPEHWRALQQAKHQRAKQTPGHRVRKKAYRQADRTKRRQLGKFTPQEWRVLCEQHAWRCACCGTQDSLTVDHIVPIARGGSNTIDNIQPLCMPCNRSKGVKIADYRIPREATQ